MGLMPPERDVRQALIDIVDDSLIPRDDLLDAVSTTARRGDHLDDLRRRRTYDIDS